MQDPIGSFLRIRELYHSYLETAFRIRDEQISAHRRDLLSKPGTLCTEPLLEPMPRYVPDELEFWDLLKEKNSSADPLKGMSLETRRTFVELVLSGLFPSHASSDIHAPCSRVPEFKPYAHQVEMLRKGYRSGSPGIVTSGTGSGKTEAFLLPLFAAICNEARTWAPPEHSFLASRWWHDPNTGRPYERYSLVPRNIRPDKAHPLRSPFRPHRQGERRTPAVRGLILYPMNALVEDQMVRLRKALDSQEVRSLMDRDFGGNRIFFGRYTSKTPVTGYHLHPGLRQLLERHPDDPELTQLGPSGVPLSGLRQSEYLRRARKIEELFNDLNELEAGQRDARYHASEDRDNFRPTRPASAFGADSPFMFPSVDGGELVTRWDMQATPPDILITNVSMLAAMLTRDVESPIFDQTKEWLKEPDAYFYLILDELHLQRGSSGTELCYLLRLLFDRLGLVTPGNRGKLRILASSASLPAAPVHEAERSAEYLWDMFGCFGLSESISGKSEAKELWLNSIVPGLERATGLDPCNLSLDSTKYIALLQSGLEPGSPSETALASNLFGRVEQEALWRAVAEDLGCGDTGLPYKELVSRSVSRMGDALAAACWDISNNRTRATSLAKVAWRLFADFREAYDCPELAPHESVVLAVRAALFVRGVGDGCTQFLGRKPDALSFRVHTFFRSIEGLFAPARLLASDSNVIHLPGLSIEREDHYQYRRDDGVTAIARMLELIYCECCGELFFGGMRPDSRPSGSFLTELLPHQPLLEGLPDDATSQRFEELSFLTYAVFWPTERAMWFPEPASRNARDQGEWIAALLDPATGTVHSSNDSRRQSSRPNNGIAGFLYVRTAGQDNHRRSNNDAETHVPYCCPRCATDYYWRQRPARLSPLRNFRAGFAKTTQLLATELFDAQRTSNPTDAPKLVSFSDSRQDAARAALDIERNHHQDIRRELLFINFHRYSSQCRRAPEQIEAELDDADSQMRTGPRSDFPKWAARIQQLERELHSCSDSSIRLQEVVETVDATTLRGGRHSVSWLLTDLVKRGVHPFDDAGVQKARGTGHDGPARYFAWDDLFEIRDDEVFWRAEETSGEALFDARRNLVHRFQQIMTDVLFSKTYFSPEESGLGFVTASPVELPTNDNPERFLEISAVMRVIGDCYRYTPSPYNPDPHPPWLQIGNIQTARMRSFAQAAWGDDWQSQLMRCLAELTHAGHAGGVLSFQNLRVRLSSPRDNFWRCSECSRVHLHRGLQICTRCCSRLPDRPSGNVETLMSQSFLGRRVQRALQHINVGGRDSAVFRLHCEELTGQTEDPARRQREFRGIFVPRLEIRGDDAAEPEDGPGDAQRYAVAHEAFEAKETIDLLSVTTTMEVGIDIGPLQVILQANMPPQRFNYQQRVGRTGRRGQAFSMVLTICRSKSHDVHYFRNPDKITGDVPPTPFLTKQLNNIASRFLWKRWLLEAFALLRQEDRSNLLQIFPGDIMRPPDIHGEFIPVATYQGGRDYWEPRLRAALESSLPVVRNFLSLLLNDSVTEAIEIPSVSIFLEKFHSQLDERVATGIAHNLAEMGLLPMYGMPTRTRNLYLKVNWRQGDTELLSIDRELDIAIYEFAPGAVVVKDKFEHLCIGCTCAFELPPYIPPGESVEVIAFQDRPFGEQFRLVQCPGCSAWVRPAEESELALQCAACNTLLSLDDGRVCMVPHAFRTDFHPQPKQDQGPSGSRHRSIQAEGQALKFPTYRLDNVDGLSMQIRLDFDKEARTYRLNRGPILANDMRGYDLQWGTERRPLSRGRTLELPHQAVDPTLLPRWANYTPVQDHGPVWLAAPKTTDSIFIAPAGLNRALALHRLPPRSDNAGSVTTGRWQGIRAAALSAAFLIVGRVALDLDIDPAELEVLEPRLYGNNERFPLIQLTDELINGAGFCRYLYEKSNGDCAPRILRTLESILTESAAYPLNQLLSPDHVGCSSACYRCLLRYGNQHYHGLLDWRLGLTFLRALTNPTFDCGLSGDFDRPGLKDWPSLAHRVCEEMLTRFPGIGPRAFANGAVYGFQLRLSRNRLSPWVLVGHPLWEWHPENGAPPDTILSVAQDEASKEGQVVCWDTFNLSRRRVKVREWILGP